MTLRLQVSLGWTLALLLAATSSLAQSIRVTSWNLAGLQPATGTNSPPISDAAAALKLTGPDVILLQNVPDWKTCDYLVQALKPAKYLVVACSSFREGTNRGGGPQVAILSRHKAYFSWTELARDGGKADNAGFAFAGIRIAGEPLGFYSTAWPDVASSEAFAGQLLLHAKSVQGWKTNRVQAAFLAGTFLAEGAMPKETRDTALASLLAGGFGSSERIPATPVAAGDFMVSEPAGIALGVTASATRGFSHAFVTWDVDIAPSALAAARAAFKPPPAKTIAAVEANPPDSKVSAPSPPAPPPMPAKSQAVQTQAVASVPNPAAPRPIASATPPAPSPPPAVRKPAPLAPKSAFEPGSIVMIGGGVLVFSGGILLLRRALRRPRVTPTKLLPDAGATSYTVVVGTPSKTGATAAEARQPQPARPVIHIDTPGATHTQAEMLRHRAEAAERKAEGAHEAIRAGVIGNLAAWLKQKFIRRLLLDRDELLATQHAATMKVLAVEERLTKIEAQINLQNLGYQQRIDDLTKELIAAKDENRELIRNQIRQVKAEMEAARERVLAQSKEQGLS